MHVQSPTGDFVVKPIVATDTPAELGVADLILLCVKSYDVPAAAEMLKPVMGAETAIVPVQNGIGHVEVIGDILGAEHVLGGVSLIMGQKTTPGIIQHFTAPDALEFGEIEGGHSDRCREIEAILAVDGFNATACPNIVERMWWKLAAYSGVGVFCVVRGDRGTIWATPETKLLYRQAIAEAVAVARAKGISLASSTPDEHIAILDSTPPQWKPSMLTALEQGHPLELEAVQGSLRAIGQKLGVPTPINDFIYSCLKPYLHGVSDGISTLSTTNSATPERMQK